MLLEDSKEGVEYEKVESTFRQGTCLYELGYEPKI